MGYCINKITEYILECDCCGEEVVFHTGAEISGDYADNDVKILQDAIRVAKFHRSKGKLLCDECFNEQKHK